MAVISARSLACVEFSSIGLGYQFLSDLTMLANDADKNIQILEASPGTSRFLILVLSEATGLRSLVDQVRKKFTESLVDVEVIDGVRTALTQALFQLAQVSLADSLVCVECKTVSALLAIGQEMLADFALEAIELKVYRNFGGGHGLFTGSRDQCARAVGAANRKLKSANRDGRIELIENPPLAFREFFNFTGLIQ